MQHTPRKRSSASGSYIKAMVMLAVLVFVYLIATTVKQKGLGAFGGMFQVGETISESPFDKLDDDGKRRLMVAIARFWERDLDTGIAWLGGRDAIELQSSGILWRVVDRWAVLPDGDTARFRHTYDAFLRPFGWAVDGDSVLTCDVRILRQMRTHGSDTCYGPRDVDITWHVGIVDGAIALSGQPFSTYQGDVYEFFPEGAVQALEDAYRASDKRVLRSAYKVDSGSSVIKLSRPLGDKGSQVNFDLDSCPGDLSFAAYARDRIAAVVETRQPGPFSEEHVRALLDSTYRTLLIEDLRGRLPAYEGMRGDTCTVTFTVSADGHTTDAAVDKKTARDIGLRDALLGHAAAWRFSPYLDGAGKNVVWSVGLP